MMSRTSYISLLACCWLAACTAQQIGNPEGGGQPFANRLVGADDPYLQQHGYDPVNWRCWNAETLAEARRVQRPLLLVIGFSASYWCQRMHEQCYRDTAIAELMNRAYIPVLIDREARPDLDASFMALCQRLGRQPCGWPLHIILTPEGQPVHVETYLSRDAWVELLHRFDYLFQTQPYQIQRLAEELRLASEPEVVSASEHLRRRQSQAEQMLGQIQTEMDTRQGGLSGAPKFLRGDLLQLLLTDAALRPAGGSLPLVKTTLDHMAAGAVYDQLGGGFFRYSSSVDWRKPQFEKMLCDQAMMVQAYARAHQLTRDPAYERMVYECLAWVEGRLGGAADGYHASIAAYSEGEQGRYYLWPRIELDGVLGPEAEIFAQYYNLTPQGNWGRRQGIPYRTLTDREWAKLYGLPLPVFQEKMERMRSDMLRARNRRLTPTRDRKQITAWNALMTSAWVAAYQALGDRAFLDRALAGGDYLLHACRSEAGGLVRYRLDGQGRGAGFLPDYAYTCRAWLDLYELTLDPRWAEACRKLAGFVITRFYDASAQCFRLTEQAHRPLANIAPAWPVADGFPRADMVMGEVLLRLHTFFDKPLYQETALALFNQALARLQAQPSDDPTGVAWWLRRSQSSYLLFPPQEVAESAYDAWRRGGYFPQTQVLQGELARTWWAQTGHAIPSSGWWLCAGGACDSLGDVSAVLARLKE